MNKINLLLALITIVLFSTRCTNTKAIAKESNSELDIPSFEGRIIYDLSYIDKTGEMTADQVEMFMGNEQIYTIKRNKYKSEMNGLMRPTTYYDGQDSLFNYIKGMENLFWIDATKNPDELISYKIDKRVEVVNGETCDKLTIISKEGKSEYYYNSKYSVNPNDYSKHEYGFWKFGIDKTNSLPMKSVSNFKDVKLEIVAKKIVPMSIDDSEFEIPNMPRVLSPEQ